MNFIPELQTYRVTQGRQLTQEKPIPRYEGMYVYDADLDDMAVIAGQRRDHGGLQQLGLWRLGNDSVNAPDKLHLGVRYMRGQPGPNGIAKDVILIASNVAGSEMRIALRPNGTTASGHSVRFDMMSSTGATQLNDLDVDTDRCTSFKMTCYIIKIEYDEFLDGVRAGKVFNHVAVTRSRFHSKQFKKPERAINIVRYTLANLRYLRAWQVASGESSPYTADAVAFMKNNSDDTTQCIRNRISMSLIDMRAALTEQLANTRPLLAKKDVAGDCLYDHLASLIESFKVNSFSSDVEEDATFQFLLGKICADGLVHPEPHHENARHFFEKGSAHQHAQSQLALGNMHAQGMGGLPIDMIKAFELYQFSAAQGNADAITVLHDAARRQAQERTELAEQLAQTRQQTAALQAAAAAASADLAAASAAAELAAATAATELAAASAATSAATELAAVSAAAELAKTAAAAELAAARLAATSVAAELAAVSAAARSSAASAAAELATLAAAAAAAAQRPPKRSFLRTLVRRQLGGKLLSRHFANRKNYDAKFITTNDGPFAATRDRGVFIRHAIRFFPSDT